MLLSIALALVQAPIELPLPTRVADAVEPAVLGLPVVYDPARSTRGDEARFAAPDIDGLRGRVLALERVADPFPSDAELVVDGEAVARPGSEVAVELWRGSVEGDPGSDVFLALSPHGSRGWIRSSAGLVHLVAERDGAGRLTRARWMEDEHLRTGAPAFECGAAELPVPTGTSTPSGAEGPLPADALGALAAQPLYRCRLAIETDHAFFQIFGDLSEAEAYAIALIGAVASTYRAEIGVVLEVPHLAFYTTPADPWSSPDFGGGTFELLDEVLTKWNSAGPLPNADLNHVISGANLGGGVAYLDTLCFAQYAYGVSANFAGWTPFPIVQGPLNWDFVVFAHELGHNFGSPHSHDYCPALSLCYPGECSDGSVCAEGSLMSYCHICDANGIANMQPTFHPVERALMRSRVEQGCLEPYADLATTGLGGGFAASGPKIELTAALDAVARELTLAYDHAPAGSVAWLVLGAATSPVPLAGGIVVPTLDALLPFATPLPGGTLGPIDLGDGFPLGVEVYAQVWALDLAAPQLWRSSDALGLALLLPAPPPALTWIAHPTNGLEYALTPPMTWPAAEALAAQVGGHLAALDTAAIQSWLNTAFVAGGSSTPPFHIGYTDRYSEGTFHWVSGATGTHVDWAPGEPNDWDGIEDYAMWPWNGNDWNDGHGLDALPALIQRPQ